VKIFPGSLESVGLSVAEVNPEHDPRLQMTNRLVNELVDGLKERRQV
jgi:arginase